MRKYRFTDRYSFVEIYNNTKLKNFEIKSYARFLSTFPPVDVRIGAIACGEVQPEGNYRLQKMPVGEGVLRFGEVD